MKQRGNYTFRPYACILLLFLPLMVKTQNDSTINGKLILGVDLGSWGFLYPRNDNADYLHPPENKQLLFRANAGVTIGRFVSKNHSRKTLHKGTSLCLRFFDFEVSRTFANETTSSHFIYLKTEYPEPVRYHVQVIEASVSLNRTRTFPNCVLLSNCLQIGCYANVKGERKVNVMAHTTGHESYVVFGGPQPILVSKEVDRYTEEEKIVTNDFYNSVFVHYEIGVGKRIRNRDHMIYAGVSQSLPYITPMVTLRVAMQLEIKQK